MTGVFREAKQVKAAYRLLDGEATTHAGVCAGHFEHVRRRSREAGLHLLIEDTTALDYHGLSSCQGLGPIGEAFTRGLWLHSTLAVRLEERATDGQWEPRVLGLFDQQAWARENGVMEDRGTRKEQLSRARESQRWAKALEAQKVERDAACQWVYVADRESDIYEVLARCEAGGARFVIRASQDRALEDGDIHVFDAVARAPCLGEQQIEVRPQGKAKRVARLQVRATTVKLRGPQRPGGRPEGRTVNVVEVREVDPPQGQEPICWRLLTDLPIDGVEAVWRVVRIYRYRWLIEEFHKAMKTGLGVEDSQLSTARRLMALAGILSVVATFLLDLKLLARAEDTRPVDVDAMDADMLAVLERKQGRPPEAWTAATLLIAIAKLGGFLARKRDGPPGWLTIWRGWQTLLLLVEGYKLAKPP